METLTILYFIYLAHGCGRAGGKVSLLDAARWMRTTKPTIKKRMDAMVDDGLLSREVQWKNGREYRWEYSITDKGQEYLDQNSAAAYQAYRVQVARVIEAIKASSNPTENQPITKKQATAEKAGQKRMF